MLRTLQDVRKSTNLINNLLSLPQDIQIIKHVRIVVVRTAHEYDTIARSPPFWHLHADALVSAEAVAVCEACRHYETHLFP